MSGAGQQNLADGVAAPPCVRRCVLTGLLLWLALPAAVYAQPPAAVFDAAYQAAHRGRVLVDVPEVYELVNVAIAITPTGISSRGLVYQQSDYYRRVREWFDPYRGHPLIARLDDALKEDTGRYFSIKMNGYAFEFDESGRIVQSRVYDRTGFRSEATNTLRPFLTDLQSFADAARFREFYRVHASTYEQQCEFYRREAGITEMRRWLDGHFPRSAGYDTYKIVFSPLVYGNQSSTWFESHGFRELQAHVNYPYPEAASGWGVGVLSDRAAAVFRGTIVFTEINHGYINPEADRHAGRILRATGDREQWVAARFGPGYYAGLGTFNEYMNWALVSLWFADAVAGAEQEAMIGSLERMTERRGFPRFAAFNRFLLDLYRRRRPGQTIADLYPQIIAWFERQQEEPLRPPEDGIQIAGSRGAAIETAERMNLLFPRFQVLIAVPGLPFVPALGLALLAWRRWQRLTAAKRVFVFAGVGAWGLYAVWESIMYVWMQTVIAPIRGDLLLIVPVLYVCGASVLILCLTGGKNRTARP